MNSLNILSSRVIGQSIPGATRPRSRSQGEIFGSSQTEDYSRGRSLSAQGVDGGKSLLRSADGANIKSEEPDRDDKEDVKSLSEKTPLLEKPSKPDVSFYKSRLQSLVKKIAAALTALLTTIGAPVVYAVSCFKDEGGHYSPFLPFKSVRPLFGGRTATTSTATAVGLSNFKGNGMTEIMAANVRKVTRFREGGEEDLEREVRRLEREARVRGAGRREEIEQRDDERDEEREEGRGYEDMHRNVVERTRQGHDLMRRRR